MPEVKAYAPVSLTYSELIRYGEWHEDAWVRQMAKLVQEMRDALEEPGDHQVSTFAELIESYDQTVSDLESELEFTKDALQDAKDAQTEAEERYKALKYDYSSDGHLKTVNHLKAEIVDLKGQYHSENARARRAEAELEKVKKALGETTEKLNMWDILRT